MNEPTEDELRAQQALVAGGNSSHIPAKRVSLDAPSMLPVTRVTFDAKKMQLIKDMIAKDCNTVEVGLFVEVCKRTCMDPFARQIYAIKRGGTMTIQMSIDGFRLIAERSGKYRGQEGPFWCGEDGEWREVWTEEENPTAAKVGILRADFAQPLWAVARFRSYYQDVGPMWKRMPDVMIAKCAEALALRRAFPNDLGGIYAQEEMDQADVEGTGQLVAPAVPAEAPAKPAPARRPRAKPAPAPAPTPPTPPTPPAAPEAPAAPPEPEVQAPAEAQQPQAEAPAGMAKVDQPTMAKIRSVLHGFGGNDERVALVQGLEPAAITADSMGNTGVTLGSLTQEQADKLFTELSNRAKAAAAAKS